MDIPANKKEEKENKNINESPENWKKNITMMIGLVSQELETNKGNIKEINCL